ncbi:MAG: hypothetical protein ACYDHH_31035 [Solirubrobacteraceae bacterium]
MGSNGVHRIRGCLTRRAWWLAAAILGLLVNASAAAAAVTPADASAAVKSFILSHDHGCGRVTIVNTTATPTFFSEVIPTRPAGVDVSVTLSVSSPYLPRAAQARFLVSGATVYADDPIAGTLANGCTRDPSGPQDPLGWHALPYLDVAHGSFAASAGPQWRGAVINPKFAVAVPGDAGIALWAAKCTAATQTIHLTRTLYLLGPADSGTVTMAGFSRTRAQFGGVPVPFDLMQLRVNGQVAFTTTNPSGGSGQLSAAGLAAIRYGPNSFEVAVTKRATGPCNGRHSAQYAVEFAFSGLFHASTSGSTGPPSGSGTCLSSSCLGSTSVPITLTNNGPATILEPVVVTNWTFTEGNTVGTTSFTSDGAPCSAMTVDLHHYQVLCEGAPFVAGRTGTVNIMFTWETQPPQSGSPFHQTWSYAWSLAGTGGGTAASGTSIVTVCSPPGPMCSNPVS